MNRIEGYTHAGCGIPFILKDGHKKIFISAPHNVDHFREGAIKTAEPETGLLALFLHNKLGCPCIINTDIGQGDPNYDEVSDYRSVLMKSVKKNKISLLLDVHQMAPERPDDVCIGTGHGQNIQNRFELVDILETSFRKQGLDSLSLDDPFPATFEHTVSRTVSRECEIPAIQLEFNTRIFFSHDTKQKVYDSMSDAIERLEGVI